MKTKLKLRILQAAASSFVELGYAKTTMRHIARKARTTEGAIYRLFGSKRQLLQYLLDTAAHQSPAPETFFLFLPCAAPWSRLLRALLATAFKRQPLLRV